MLSTKICLEFWIQQQKRLVDYLQLLTSRGSDFPEIERAFLVQKLKPQTNLYIFEKKNISTTHDINLKWFGVIPHRKNMSRKNAPKLDFKTIKYWWFLNTHRKFKIRRKILVFGLNNLPIPPTQICKKKKSELAFALFRSEVFVLILGALRSTNL